MAYPKTRAKMDEHCLSAEDLREILYTYADEVEEQEPYATNSISRLREVAGSVFDLED